MIDFRLVFHRGRLPRMVEFHDADAMVGSFECPLRAGSPAYEVRDGSGAVRFAVHRIPGTGRRYEIRDADSLRGSLFRVSFPLVNPALRIEIPGGAPILVWKNLLGGQVQFLREERLILHTGEAVKVGGWRSTVRARPASVDDTFDPLFVLGLATLVHQGI